MKIASRTVLAIAASIALSACGGSKDDEENSAVLKAGDKFEVSTSIDDQEVALDTFKVYAVSSKGELTDDPDYADTVDLQISLLQPSESNSKAPLLRADSTSPEELKVFFSELWTELQRYYPDYQPQQIADEYSTFELDLSSIYQDYRSSALSVAEYVAFFENLDSHFGTLSEEVPLLNFLLTLQINQRQWLDALQNHSISWDSFLQRMKGRGEGFEDLRSLYLRQYAEAGLEKFLDAYLSADLLQADGGDKSPSGLDIAKFVWDIIKDNRPTQEIDGAYTWALSSADADAIHYAQAKRGATEVIKVRGRNLFGMTLFEAKFNLTGYHDARHATIGGSWLPSVAYDVTEAYGLWPWKTNASAVVQTVANVGSFEQPDPELVITAKFKFSSPLQSKYYSYNFKAGGSSGFTYLGQGK